MPWWARSAPLVYTPSPRPLLYHERTNAPARFLPCTFQSKEVNQHAYMPLKCNLHMWGMCVMPPSRLCSAKLMQLLAPILRGV